MKKICSLALVGVMGFSVAQINVTAAGEETLAAGVMTEQMVEMNTQPMVSTLSTATEKAKVVITELSAYPMQVEFASLAGADTVVRDTDSIFEFIELHNYGSVALDLNDYQLTLIQNGTTYVNPWKFEEGSDGIIDAGETFVIFNYTAHSFKYGPNNEYSMKYDTPENLAAAWDTFNEFYGINVPVENRVMSLCVDEEGKAIAGAMAQLPSTGSNSLRLVNKEDGTVVAQADYTRATLNLSHNYVPTETEVGELLCVNGVSPYRLLHEQDVNYNPTFDFSGEKFRLINYNLLFTGYDFAARSAAFIDFLTTYQPDIMTLEEIAIEWYGYLNEVLPALGYTYIQVNVQTGGTVPTYHSDSSNPIIYKTDKFDCLEYGTRWATEDGTFSGSKWDSVNRIRMINFAVFESKATGNKLNVLATHGYLTGDQSKTEQAKLAKGIAAEMEEKYDCSSAIMGDMNYEEGSKQYQLMVTDGLYQDSKYVAKNWTYRMTCASFGTCEYGATSATAPWDQYAGVIDFVFVSAGTQVENYKVLNQTYYNENFSAEKPNLDCHISDHLAVLVDMYI
ncbi:MAG: lamin tail domain-containing protein [Clostridia bacterium]|nr:lamin tail domain-containing protein [Clostridia bacterium]